LKGNFNQLRKLKQLYPGLKVMMSIGGWTESYRFSDAALPANRAAFVASCVDQFIRGNFAAGVTGPGIFDGIDIDWEYPGRCGASCNWRAEDRQNFTALLAEFRSQLNAINPNLLLTIAAPSSEYFYSQIELSQIPQHLSWVNLMTYDYHGSWEPGGPANHHSPLYSSPADPSEGQWSSDKTVRGYLAGGVPASKLVLGLPFMGHGWTGVADGGAHGLYQLAAGVAPGTFEAGVEDFKTLEALGYPGYWDDQSQAYWIYNGSVFWSYDNAASATNKMSYVKAMNLRGAMFWELSGDSADGALITAIWEGLQ
jgi:chitinase